MPEPAYIIGIDLGTTNSVVAYTDAVMEKGGRPDIRIFKIPQITSPGVVEALETLASFIYMPTEPETSEGGLALPWDSDSRPVVGEYARARSAEVPQRVISSAKSWLCNSRVDRNSPVLPWEAPPDVEKISPVEATAAIISHIRDAWNSGMAVDDPDIAFENQEILITVPASFDAVARDLTVKAAKSAGLDRITLLEEPQAAFYSWIEDSGDKWREAVLEGDSILVCDIGGGTSDFTLIRVVSKDGDLGLERCAVGDHLLVGGDNMDLALAYFIAGKMAEKGTRLDSWQIRSLVHACRSAKEKMDADPLEKSFPITILGRGSSLIGGTVKFDLPVEEMEKLIVNGFYPECGMAETPLAPKKSGLREQGLDYVDDPAITRHLAAFISRSLESENPKDFMLNAVLFNGGAAKSKAVRKRLTEIIGSWFGDGKTAVSELDNRSFDLSVARGAACYGLARKGHGIRIRAGLSRTCYIGVAASMPAVPGMSAPVKALCVAPFGMEEGESLDLADREFTLVVGEPVIFDFLASAARKEDKPGIIIEDWADELDRVTTLETTLDGEPGASIAVVLRVVVTETGTLEIWCVSKGSKQEWKLEFNAREKE
ncbi:MAG: Hsp70 family protein [Deltaproteobacteria bacterium]|nr:Hsp70 family protein [Deltaproteobacteria bacterium]